MRGPRVDDGRLAVAVSQQSPIPLEASFDCGPGELLALTGPSGSGKSTLLRCIAGIDRSAHGTIACAGRVWLDSVRGVNLSPQARNVGIVFQHYALFPHLTALGNVI
ncbi:MAG TPA: ATP-binding cassette domain-containing protein, partial [Casimicrobiaceae bacterium]